MGRIALFLGYPSISLTKFTIFEIFIILFRYEKAKNLDSLPKETSCLSVN